MSERVIDIGLTVIGYLAAAGLGMLIHSAVSGRRRLAAARVPESVTPPRQAASVESVGVQFVDLRSSRGRSEGTEREAHGQAQAAKTDHRRDRPEIIRLARQMLNAGTPAEMIRRTLPITDAELAWLQSANAR
jgi:hypothetical protein